MRRGALLCVLAMGLAACDGGAPASPEASKAGTAGPASDPPIETPVATPVVTPLATSSSPALGAPVQAGSWTITINGIETAESDDQFIEPDPGNRFWVLDVTLQNDAAEPATSGSGITLQDDQDFTHDAEFLGVKEPALGGNVPAGARARGYLTFQITEDAAPIAVLFQPDPFDSSVIVTIALR